MSIERGLLHRHVRQSNLIEGIVSFPGRPLYDGHLVAAMLAAKGDIVHPNKLHKALVRKIPRLRVSGGSYRTRAVWVGKKEMPRYKNVPSLMEDWSSMVEEYQSMTKDFEEASFFLHDWFLCIHPYIDGNGRTARLVLNMLRVNKGLPWLVIESKSRASYYRRIRAFEDILFKEHYPNVYR